MAWFSILSFKYARSWKNKTKDATLYSQELKEGDSWHNPPCQPHQLVCMSNSGSVSEVSTPDHSDDNYRIVKGDSQKDSKNNPEKK